MDARGLSWTPGEPRPDDDRDRGRGGIGPRTVRVAVVAAGRYEVVEHPYSLGAAFSYDCWFTPRDGGGLRYVGKAYGLTAATDLCERDGEARHAGGRPGRAGGAPG